MKFFTVALFVVAAVVSCCFADTIQLQPSQAILIPAPLVPLLRFTRTAYGGGEHSHADNVGSYATTYGRPSSTSSSSLAGSLYVAGDRSLQSPRTHSTSAYSGPAASSYSSPAAPQTNSAPSSYPPSASYSAPDYFSYPAQPYSAASSTSPSYMLASSSAYQSYVAPAAGIPNPPCPTNYLFSCQPSMKPVPCSNPVPSSSILGAAVPPHLMQQGAYSQQVPQYAIPVVREIY